jgi:hypothetical protein
MGRKRGESSLDHLKYAGGFCEQGPEFRKLGVLLICLIEHLTSEV